MSRTFLPYRYLFLSGALIFSFSIGHSIFSQHEGHDMAGMHKAKPTARKKKSPARKRTQVKKHQIGNMAGMNMTRMHKAKAAGRRNRTRMTSQPAKKHQMENMPGMNMPQSPSSASPRPQASPGEMDMNMPGMHMPGPSSSASPKPVASPQMDMNMPMPGMSPAASPATSPEKMDMNMPMPSQSPGAKPGTMDDMKGMDMTGAGAMSMGPLMVMSGNDMSIRVGSSDTNLLPMGQMSSGTSWAPAATPMYMSHKQSGDWLLMFHYNFFVGVNSQGGPRGVTKFESANWFMPMAFHKLGKGTLQLRGMFSFEPFTFPPGGSPLLFQTGETYKSQPLIDKQHPHDLFMELSAQYTHPLGERGTWFTYFGYPGEPALGPPAFMHRQSASENPSATLSHHVQDSTHITFGVLTTGFTYRWFKLEGSVFNGREPDENRYNFDAHRWNSRSARLSFAPNNNWSMQLSYGFLRSPEVF
jgi:hypothetical protein